MAPGDRSNQGETQSVRDRAFAVSHQMLAARTKPATARGDLRPRDDGVAELHARQPPSALVAAHPRVVRSRPRSVPRCSGRTSTPTVPRPDVDDLPRYQRARAATFGDRFDRAARRLQAPVGASLHAGSSRWGGTSTLTPRLEVTGERRIPAA